MAEQSKEWIDDNTLRVMTHRSGAFTFALGCLPDEALLRRIDDAQLRFNKTPTVPEIIDKIQDKVLVSSVYSTNTIEGGEFSEEETDNILHTDPKEFQKTAEKRLFNLKDALLWVNKHRNLQFEPTQGKPFLLADITHLHALVSQGLDEGHNPVGQFRDNEKWQKTYVGNAESGGRYQPPKCLKDIEYLLQAWIEWLNSPAIIGQHVIVRASLAHYYFELIHPFWDGNGRTGRLIEMLIYEQSGYRLSSSAIWQYYQQNIHEYFALFNHCRKQAKAKKEMSNQAFIDFVMEGMLQTINDLHDQCNQLIGFLLYQGSLNNAKFNKVISERQFNTIMVMMGLSDNYTSAALLRNPQIKALYSNLTERTFYRDIGALINAGFLSEQDGKLVFAI
jgi:Fic family protein